MEAVSLVLFVLGLLLLPLLAVLLMALCVRCRELPGSYGTAASDGLTPSSIVIKPPPTVAPWPPATSYPPVTYLLQSQPDLLRIPRSPQPPGGSPRMPSSQQDSDGANSVASYENEEAVCEDADEDEDEEDYPEGYLVVLPDNVPATGAAVPPAPASSNPGLRDSAFSMESGEDYVNVPESEESADASLDGSREYVNVSQELPPVERTKPAGRSSQEVEGEEAPDYENLQIH
ncbi:linker for activation of T-cells family member 1 isoform X3 [Neophocaena asiaeorientalis asiaeorientalis]|uniref:Linker for activation of T-cells family member 1 isoform X3 n=2 Tax=Phocoenidae TaxID=9740 RepID=A0A341BDA8_NEOAA|nr:linker for activation of T-cells family member 1 isoform X3 [Neophocaena asiaeorientalis asiaeorientalis]XP_032461326.1 linker for activation of T-cells family member 1 isoform X4 [Phocoena sinus]